MRPSASSARHDRLAETTDGPAMLPDTSMSAFSTTFTGQATRSGRVASAELPV